MTKKQLSAKVPARQAGAAKGLQEYTYIVAYYPKGEDILAFKHRPVHAKDHDDAYTKGGKLLADKIIKDGHSFQNDYVIPVVEKIK